MDCLARAKLEHAHKLLQALELLSSWQPQHMVEVEVKCIKNALASEEALGCYTVEGDTKLDDIVKADCDKKQFKGSCTRSRWLPLCKTRTLSGPK